MSDDDQRTFEDYQRLFQERVEATIQQQFLDFHQSHPVVYTTLVRLARQWSGASTDRLGIGMLWEVMRWEIHLSGLPDPEETFKLNNNYRSRYSRLIMDRETDLAGVFETRRLRSA